MDSRVLRAIRTMEREIGEALSTEVLADEAGLSVHHFHRLFTDELGEPPATFLRRIRMDAAALRLQWSNEPASVIASALGFQSRPAFIRALAARGLHLTCTQPSQYVACRHRGPGTAVVETYDLILHGWIAPSGRAPGNEPALEIYTVPRHLQDRETLDFTILVPVD